MYSNCVLLFKCGDIYVYVYYKYTTLKEQKDHCCEMSVD